MKARVNTASPVSSVVVILPHHPAHLGRRETREKLFAIIPRVNKKSCYDGVRTVFLDRDGVLNRKAPEGAYVSQWDHVELLPGTAEALRLLQGAGLPVYVVTNQRGAALGLYSTEDIERVHTRMAAELTRDGGAVAGFFYCPHDKNCCDCRKPLPGLFEQARTLHPEIAWETSLMVGDSLSDIEAGRNLGMRTIFIDGEPERQKAGAEKARTLADGVCGSLLEAVRLVLGA